MKIEFTGKKSIHVKYLVILADKFKQLKTTSLMETVMESESF